MEEKLQEVAKNVNTDILWGMIADTARTMGERMQKPDYSQSRSDKQVSETWYTLFKVLVSEADDRFNKEGE